VVYEYYEKPRATIVCYVVHISNPMVKVRRKKGLWFDGKYVVDPVVYLSVIATIYQSRVESRVFGAAGLADFHLQSRRTAQRTKGAPWRGSHRATSIHLKHQSFLVVQLLLLLSTLSQ